MTDDSAPKADGLKYSEIRGRSRPDEGARPIRKRGMHRAVKRGETWALLWDMSNRLMRDMSNELYRSLVFEPSSFAGLSEIVKSRE